ncbi:MAG: AAA domain-containing protein, partial [Halobaculum sp.]
VRRLDTYPSELSVDRQLTALHDAVLKGDQRRKDVLFGRTGPSFESVSGTYVDNNAAQDRAVRRAVAAEDLALIHGPPGTGKTYTVARTVQALLARGERVLLSAFTNRAVDNALEAIREQGVADAVRAGRESGESSAEVADGGTTASESSAFEDVVVRVGTEEGVRGDMQDVRLIESGDPGERVRALADAPVVAATTAACGSRVMREQSFDVALVDEASQLTEPATLAAINRADRFVLVGDHEQLPPVVQAEGGVPVSEADLGSGVDSTEGGSDVSGGGGDVSGGGGDVSSDETTRPPRADLSESLFERLIERYPDAGVTLTSQYRMSQRIQAFASAEFYDGRLRPASGAVAGRSLADLGVSASALPASVTRDSDTVDGVSFVDPDGRREGNTNPVEAACIADLVAGYVAAGVDPDDIGVIAPFRAQVAEIGRRTDVTVDTVDRFQGSSKEVIVVSFVATDTLDSPIFEDYRRVNVALTRAKRALTLVGDETALRSDPVYERMVDWA